MTVIGLSSMFYFSVVLWFPPCHTSMWDSRCRVFQHVHGSLMVGGESDKILYSSKGVVAYGIKGT